MVTVYGGRNVTRLARESGVPRESLSKILAYRRGLGPDVASKLAGPLMLSAEILLPPAEEIVTLGTLARHLAALGASVEQIQRQAQVGRNSLSDGLEKIDDRLARIERRLFEEDDRAREADG